MRFQRFFVWLTLVAFGLGAVIRPGVARAAPQGQVSAYELILAMNTLRVSSGLLALIEDPIVNAVAQSTAATMAANNRRGIFFLFSNGPLSQRLPTRLPFPLCPSPIQSRAAHTRIRL